MGFLKSLVFVLPVALFSTAAFAGQMDLYCETGVEPETCLVHVQNALTAIGCDMQVELTKCDYTVKHDPKSTNIGKTVRGDSSYCDVESTNCRRPAMGLFGGDSCGNVKMVQVASDAGVNNGYWYGIFGSYSRNICLLQ